MTTPDGTIVNLISRDCCPYLDDYEPNYGPAASAVTACAASQEEHEWVRPRVEWDLEGITYDEPKPFKKRARPKGRCPFSDFDSVCSDDDYPYPSNASLTAQVLKPSPLAATNKESDWTAGGEGTGNPRPHAYTQQAAAPAPDVPDASQEGPEVDEDIAPIDEELEEFPEDPSGDGGDPPGRRRNCPWPQT